MVWLETPVKKSGIVSDENEQPREIIAGLFFCATIDARPGRASTPRRRVGWDCRGRNCVDWAG